MVMHDNCHILATLSSTEIPVSYFPSNVQLKCTHKHIHDYVNHAVNYVMTLYGIV